MHDVAERGPRRADGLRRRHPRRAQLPGLHGHHVPGRRVRLGRPPPPDGDRRAHEVGHRRHALRRHHRRDRERDRRQRRRVPARRSRSSPRTGRRSGTRSATPTPGSSATTWPPTSASPAWTTRSSSTTPCPTRSGTSSLQENHINATPRDHQDGDGLRALRSARSSTRQRRRRPGRPRGLRRQPRHGDRHATRTAPGTLPGPDDDGIGDDGKPVDAGAVRGVATSGGSSTRTG